MLSLFAAAALGAGELTAQHSFVDPRAAIEEIISSNKIVIFSNSNCRESEKVKELFEDYGAAYASFELDERLDGKMLAKTLATEQFQPRQNLLAKNLPSSSVPAVFVRGQPVSHTALQGSHKSGELQHWIE